MGSSYRLQLYFETHDTKRAVASSSGGGGGYKQWICDIYNSLVPLAAWQPLHCCIYDSVIVADSDFASPDDLLLGAPLCLFVPNDGLFHTGRYRQPTLPPLLSSYPRPNLT